MAKFIMTTQSEDRIGIVAALTGCLSDNEGFIHNLAQFGTPNSERFFSRICFSVDKKNESNLRNALAEISSAMDLNIQIYPKGQKMRTLIMASKFDHCLNDLLYRHNNGSLKISIPAVASNHETHRKQVEAAGIPFIIFQSRKKPNPKLKHG